MQQRVATQSQQGFTLIEILITSSVLAVVTAIAMPSFQNANMASNETSAITALRSIQVATEAHRVRFGGLPSSVEQLQQTGLIDEVLGAVETDGRHGYNFSFSSTSSKFTVHADPAELGITGRRYFFVDQSGIVRFEEGGQANASSPAID